MNDIIIGATIAIITAIITLSFTEYIKYYFSTKKDEQNLILESLKKMKRILIDTKFALMTVCVSCYKTPGKTVPKISPDEINKLWRILIELNAVSFELSTYPKTENLSKLINKLYDDANIFLNLLDEKTNFFKIQISQTEDKEIFEEILSKYHTVTKEIEELMKTSISITK